jgi:hypothetical protein
MLGNHVCYSKVASRLESRPADQPAAATKVPPARPPPPPRHTLGQRGEFCKETSPQNQFCAQCTDIIGIVITHIHDNHIKKFGGFLTFSADLAHCAAASRHHIGNTHSCLLLYYILAEEELLSLLAAEMVSVEINVHDNASIVVIVLKIWWCPLWLLRLLLLLHDGENITEKSG